MRSVTMKAPEPNRGIMRDILCSKGCPKADRINTICEVGHGNVGNDHRTRQGAPSIPDVWGRLSVTLEHCPQPCLSPFPFPQMSYKRDTLRPCEAYGVSKRVEEPGCARKAGAGVRHAGARYHLGAPDEGGQRRPHCDVSRPGQDHVGGPHKDFQQQGHPMQVGRACIEKRSASG